jgi:aspartyl-tRNA(Asn)/glutamyl-tRNA(Gln) amidotransferase subunit B
MSEYIPTIGLEIHAELKTKTKMFCSSKNDSEEKRPNSNICPVCMGYPGTLPVINFEAVRQVLRFGTAIGATLADYTEFDRKNYFYPDIPKGYQLSQYKHPLVKGGEILGVQITRVHLEEDTARSTHDKGEETLVDFNRAGVPLMELVTEPVIHDAKTASAFAKELQLILTYLGASDANMEKGEMRVEANISISKDMNTFGTKVEVKNLNSFKAVEKAIAFEIARHAEILERGEKVMQETRGWNEKKEETFSQRAKEDSHDYRYFPDPDLPKLFISKIPEFSYETLKATLPELPQEKRQRLTDTFGLSDEHVEIYVSDKERGEYLEKVAKELQSKELVRLASNYITSDLKVLIPVGEFVEVIKMISNGDLSSRGGKEVLKIISTEGGTAKAIAQDKNLIQKSNTEELKKIVEAIINENQKVAEEYKNGNTAVIQYLVGQGMKVSKGSANPQVLKSIFEEFLRG